MNGSGEGKDGERSPEVLPPDPANPPPAEPAGVPHVEWTVSDRRGPLSSATVAAPDEEDVERFVPGSEADAEGSRDAVPPADLAGGSAAASAGPAGNGPATSPERDTKTGAGPNAAPQRRSAWPVAAAVILGAAVGAGSAALVYAQHAGAGANGLDARVAALEQRPDPRADLAALKNRVDDMSRKLAASSSAAPATAPAGGTAALAAQVATLQGDVAALKRSAPGTGDADKLAALTAAVAGARGEIDALKDGRQQLDNRIAALQAVFAGAQKQAASTQSDLDGLRSGQKDLAGKVGAPALAVVSDSLVEQVAAGKPYATQVDALVSLGADPAKVAVLRENANAGVPSAQTLLAKFRPLADPMIATGSKTPADAGFGERLKHGLFGLVSVRRADEVTGTDLPSRVALIEADLGHNDIAGAFAAWSALPPDAKQRSAGWGALAKTSVEAMGAARALQSQSIGALAAKRS